MNSHIEMPEEFLHHVWERRLFNSINLKTTDDKKLEIIQVGKRNRDAGPDFFNARIRISGTVWAGNVEIHCRSSDWITHRHQDDMAYDNVILHVVVTDDRPLFRKTGETVPTLILTIPQQYRSNYKKLLDSRTWIACQNQFHKVNPVMLQLGFHRLMIERLETKTEEIGQKLKQNSNDWNETFYQFLTRTFGFKVNSLPFELLSNSVSFQLLGKYSSNLFRLEAILFGNSGLLNQQLIGDDYYLQLREEYSFLYKKHKLKGIEGHLWKFLRLRPGNFPTIRIAQLAALIHRSPGLFSSILACESLKETIALFRVRASSYWETHYNFNKSSNRKSVKELGKASIFLLIINTVIPFLFVYGEKMNRSDLKDKALEFLEQIPPESNSVTRKWASLGVTARSAFESQALLQLKNSYCEKKKCLNCQIGVKLVADHESI